MLDLNHSFLATSSIKHYSIAIISLWFLIVSPTINIWFVASWFLLHSVIGTCYFILTKETESVAIKDTKITEEEKLELGMEGELKSPS